MVFLVSARVVALLLLLLAGMSFAGLPAMALIPSAPPAAPPCDPHLDKRCADAAAGPLGKSLRTAYFLPAGWSIVGDDPQALAPPAPAAPASHDTVEPDPLLNVTVRANVTVVTPWGTVHRGIDVVVAPALPQEPEPGAEPDGGWAPTVPCSDPAGCPDLVVELATLASQTTRSTRSFAATDCNVAEGTVSPGFRRLVRFTTTTTNYGDGKLALGVPALSPGWFAWGSCHGHWHLTDYADYRLWTLEGYQDWREAREGHPNATATQVLDAHPGLSPEMVNGHKQGFCVIDLRQMEPFAPSNFWSCNDQGISPGWADEYTSLLDGQWIDVTDVSEGLYVLEVEVNAERFFEESDYNNNAAAVLVYLPEPDLW